MPKNLYLLLMMSALVISGCAKEKQNQLANPASQSCVNKGGTLHTEKRRDGGEFGICLFQDNRQCEEWALFRGDCPLEGINITGYLTPEGRYCAIRGGKVLQNETLCHLPSGKKCSSKDLYHGKC